MGGGRMCTSPRNLVKCYRRRQRTCSAINKGFVATCLYLGQEYKGPNAENITPINGRETVVAATLLVLAIVLGVYPDSMFEMMRASTTLLAENLDAAFQAFQQTSAGLADPATGVTTSLTP